MSFDTPAKKLKIENKQIHLDILEDLIYILRKKDNPIISYLEEIQTIKNLIKEDNNRQKLIQKCEELINKCKGNNSTVIAVPNSSSVENSSEDGSVSVSKRTDTNITNGAISIPTFQSDPSIIDYLLKVCNDLVSSVDMDSSNSSAQLNVKTVYDLNTNKLCHFNSLYADTCLICLQKTENMFAYRLNLPSTVMVLHYVNVHGDCEVPISRLSSRGIDILQHQHNISAVLVHSMSVQWHSRYSYKCVFCNRMLTMTLYDWYEHFSSHTGEYDFYCSKCMWRYPLKSGVIEHCKTKCQFDDSLVNGVSSFRKKIATKIDCYVCKECNYVQLKKSRVLRHLQVEHGYTIHETSNKIIKLKLIQTPAPESATTRQQYRNHSPLVETDLDLNCRSLYVQRCFYCHLKSPDEPKDYMALHYASHNLTEIPTARLSQPDVYRLRVDCNKYAEIKYSLLINEPEYLSICIFCQMELVATVKRWYQHYTTHTGELNYKCEPCGLRSFDDAVIAEHQEKSESECHISRVKCQTNVDSNMKHILVFVCFECNYSQLIEDNLIFHILKRHCNYQYHVFPLISFPRINELPNIDVGIGLDKPQNISAYSICSSESDVGENNHEHTASLEISELAYTDYANEICLVDGNIEGDSKSEINSEFTSHDYTKNNNDNCEERIRTALPADYVRQRDQTEMNPLESHLFNRVISNKHTESIIENCENDYSDNRDVILVEEVSTEATTLDSDLKNKGTQNDILNVNKLNHCHDIKKITQCIICKYRHNDMVGHYVNYHTDSEVLISRLPPQFTEHVLQDNYNNIYFWEEKILSTCIFCNMELFGTLTKWFEHFATHTGNFPYQCFACNMRFPKLDFEHHCSAARTICKVEWYNELMNTIEAYICLKCNFIQLSRDCMNDHIMLQHGNTIINEYSYQPVILLQLIHSQDELLTKLQNLYEPVQIDLSQRIMEEIRSNDYFDTLRSVLPVDAINCYDSLSIKFSCIYCEFSIKTFYEILTHWIVKHKINNCIPYDSFYQLPFFYTVKIHIIQTHMTSSSLPRQSSVSPLHLRWELSSEDELDNSQYQDQDLAGTDSVSPNNEIPYLESSQSILNASATTVENVSRRVTRSLMKKLMRITTDGNNVISGKTVNEETDVAEVVNTDTDETVDIDIEKYDFSAHEDDHTNENISEETSENVITECLQRDNDDTLTAVSVPITDTILEQLLRLGNTSIYYFCSECYQIFLQKSISDLHVQSRHNQGFSERYVGNHLLYGCWRCYCYFGKNTALMQHMHHHIASYECNVCSDKKKFTKFDELKEHFREDHVPLNDFYYTASKIIPEMEKSMRVVFANGLLFTKNRLQLTKYDKMDWEPLLKSESGECT